MAHKACPHLQSLLSLFLSQREFPHALPQHRRERSLLAEQLCRHSYVGLQSSTGSVQLSTDERPT